MLDESVVTIGILPFVITCEGISDVYIDISGLGAKDEQLSPFKSFVIKNKNTDNIMVDMDFGRIPPQRNNPCLNNESQSSEKYADEITYGFSNLYQWLMKHKEEFSSIAEKSFEGVSNRIILKPTSIYTQLLRTSYHPDFLGCPAHRDVLLSRIGIHQDVNFKIFLPAEYNSLQSGEVPYFQALISERHIYDSCGTQYNNFIDKSPWQEFRDKLDKLCEEDLSRQIKLIKMSFMIKSKDTKTDETGISFNQAGNSKDSSGWIRLACDIGGYLLDNSIVSSGKYKFRTWVGAVLGRNETAMTISPVSDDFYSGNSGIALFLAYLGYITGNEEYINTAIDAMYSSIAFGEKASNGHPYLIGAFNGLSGNLYTLYKLYSITGNKALLNAVNNYLFHIENIIGKDNNYDVISGCAGCLGVVLSILNKEKDAELKKRLQIIAEKCCAHLIDTALADDSGGVYWENTKSMIIPSSGFGHGNAGMAAYLARFNSFSHDGNVDTFLKKVLSFERSLIIREKGNWFSTNRKDKCGFGWCHGAPGMLLSKVILLKSGFTDEHLESEFKAALNTTVSRCFGNNPTFCHGDLGNLDILLYASMVLKDTGLQKQCIGTFDNVYEKILQQRWRRGVYRETDTLGLMIGLAGFGYSLLRFASPNTVPSCLALD